VTVAERKYSTYEKECLAVIFGCKKCRNYLEDKEFELHCDYLALCWLLKRVKDVGRFGRWILRSAPNTPVDSTMTWPTPFLGFLTVTVAKPLK
jgi:hypothetical protein